MSSSAIVNDTLSMSSSAIVADTASGYHLLTIHGYSRTKGIPTGEFVRSSAFTICGHRWSIDYYPNGARAAVADYVSLSLNLDEDVFDAVKAQYDFCIAGEAEEPENVAALASAPVERFPSRTASLHAMFIKRERLERSRHLMDDSFTIRCDIVVVHNYRGASDDAPAFVSVPPCDLRWHFGELLKTEKGADVVFEVGGETIVAHRCVLAAHSSVFSAELFGQMVEGNAAGVVVRIEDMNAEVFKALLHFVYTGSLPKPRKEDEDFTYQHLLVAADRYGMERLKLICEEKLCQYINVGSAAIILALAEQHHCVGLKKACFSFLAAPANLRAVVATDGFQHLSKSCPSLMVEVITMSCALVE
ncbi:BTB/POZ and MATH domain-containing protein 1-like [Lolium rigidum]|uniref:BTB/POZ and MATH domain-containing protein 1-like n=1 Tax=Lolium rigidum TaxID=89674 RepID=UPI001F5D2BE3|nr:BTB/POZ and MATH domain-containing protein 1-like [Lolium rigidum]